MSAQLIEILILAIIAILIISKLLSVLGNTDEDDPAKKRQSFFGEASSVKSGLKDVTGITESVDNRKKQTKAKSLIFGNDAKTNAVIEQIIDKMPEFNPDKFLHGAKIACQMIIKALLSEDQKSLTELVDKRFVDNLANGIERYKIINTDAMAIAFEDAYSFGNSIYIKVAISEDKFKEFWIFTRNINVSSPNWYLSNIEV